MTITEAVTLFKARKTGRGRWIARCPHHPDRRPSLAVEEGRKMVLLTCRSHGCDLKSICKAVGITVEKLYYDSGHKIDDSTYRALQRKRKAEDAIDRQLGRLGLMLWLYCIDRAKKNYWRKALWGTYEEVCLHWKSIYPDELLPVWMRPRIDRQCIVCGFRWRGYAGQVCPFTPLPKEDREHVAY